MVQTCLQGNRDKDYNDDGACSGSAGQLKSCVKILDDTLSGEGVWRITSQIHYVGHFFFIPNIQHTPQIQEEGKIHIWPHTICQKFMHISHQKSIHSSFTLPSLALI